MTDALTDALRKPRGDLLFDRSVTVTVGTKQFSDLDVVFSVKKNLKATPNTCDLKIYNLSKDSRSALETIQDKDTTPVQIEAGYVNATSIIFLGDLRRVDSGYQDGPDIVTVLSSGDGEKKHRTARVNISVKPQTSTHAVLTQVVKALGVSEGNLADAANKLSFASIGSMFSEGTVLSGSASREMDRICKSVGLTYSIQNGKLQLLPLGKVLDGLAINVSAQHGMVGTPTVDSKGILKVRVLMVPDVFPGRKIVLDSKRLKGQYRIESTHHFGDTHGQDWYIDIEGKRY